MFTVEPMSTKNYVRVTKSESVILRQANNANKLFRQLAEFESNISSDVMNSQINKDDTKILKERLLKLAQHVAKNSYHNINVAL